MEWILCPTQCPRLVFTIHEDFGAGLTWIDSALFSPHLDDIGPHCHFQGLAHEALHAGICKMPEHTRHVGLHLGTQHGPVLVTSRPLLHGATQRRHHGHHVVIERFETVIVDSLWHDSLQRSAKCVDVPTNVPHLSLNFVKHQSRIVQKIWHHVPAHHKFLAHLLHQPQRVVERGEGLLGRTLHVILEPGVERSSGGNFRLFLSPFFFLVRWVLAFSWHDSEKLTAFCNQKMKMPPTV